MKEVVLNIRGTPDITLVTEHKVYPINTRFVANDSRCYRYMVDEKGYRWIGEELWHYEIW